MVFSIIDWSLYGVLTCNQLWVQVYTEISRSEDAKNLIEPLFSLWIRVIFNENIFYHLKVIC